VNSLPKTVTQQRHGCDLNPGPSAPDSSMLTTRLPSHPHPGSPRKRAVKRMYVCGVDLTQIEISLLGQGVGL